MDEGRKLDIIDALVTILSAIREIDDKPKDAGDNKKFRPYSMSELIALPPESSLVKNPVRSSLKLGVRKIGVILDKEGGMVLMQEICGRIQEMSINDDGSAVDIIDKSWSGVGDWIA